MAAPSHTNSSSLENASPLTSSTGEDPHRYSRTMRGSGDRLATACNQAHAEGTFGSTEPFRTATGSISADVASSVRGLASRPPGASFGWEKGSYRSPFDYNQSTSSENKNKAAYQPSSFSSAPTGPAASARAHYIPVLNSSVYALPNNPQSTPSAQALTDDMKITSPICPAVTPGPDGKDRLLLLAPLRMIRSAGKRLNKHDQVLLYTFLDMHLADKLHTVVECDRHLPSIIYKISIPMTDFVWTKYNELLTVFGFANAVHEMLAQGSRAFDEYTYAIDETVDRAHAQAWSIMVSRLKDVDNDKLAEEIMELWAKKQGSE